MKFFALLMVVAAAALPLAACDVSHHEETHQGLFGGTKHESTTVTDSPLGTTVEKHESTTH